MRTAKYLFVVFLLFFACKDRHNPFSLDEFGLGDEYGTNWQNNLDIIENLGRIRDLHFEDNRLFIATEDNGIYIYDILSEADENSLQLKNGQFLKQLYQSEEWGNNKDLRSIYYSDDHEMLFALDYNNNTYLGYTEFLLNDIEDSDYLIQNSCGPDANARRFFINTESTNPELYVLYKCFEGSSQCVNNPYQNIATTMFTPLSGSLYDDFQVFGDFSIASNCTGGSQIDGLSVDTNDMFFNNDKFFVANPTNGINSFAVYEENGSLIDEYTTEYPVRSIYSINNVILAGTENGCYITLLDDNSISDISESKLVIAEGLTIYDIFYDENKLILSCGNRGILIYDWNGLSITEPSENLRIFSTNSDYSTTARFYNGMYFIGTEYGLQIYNIQQRVE